MKVWRMYFPIAIVICIVLWPRSYGEIVGDSSWAQHKKFGQVSGITTDNSGNVYVFHRGDRIWDAFTFDINNVFVKGALGPIKQHTIAVFSSNGTLLATSGSNIFYLPHGITVDNDGNIWLTDVALHQVLKFPPIKQNVEMSNPILTLGQALVPGSDLDHFCKPTSVAVDSRNGDFYVADGYCNSRIMKYNKNGTLILKWGKAPPFRAKLGPYFFTVPHSLALDEARNHIFVADRENSRIMCYNLTNGEFMQELHGRDHVYAVTFSPPTNVLYFVTGLKNGVGYGVNETGWKRTAEFKPPKNFDGAHDIAVSPDGQYVYVIELTEDVIWRFPVGGEIHSESPSKIPATPQITSSVADTSKALAPEAKASDSVALTKVGVSEGSDLFDAISGLDSNLLAVFLVTLVALLGVLAIACHVFQRKGRTHGYESRGLILHEDEDR